MTNGVPAPELLTKGKTMNDVRCGTGLPLSALEADDAKAMADFGRFLNGQLAYDTVECEYLPLSEAGRAGVVTRRPLHTRGPR